MEQKKKSIIRLKGQAKRGAGRAAQIRGNSTLKSLLLQFRWDNPPRLCPTSCFQPIISLKLPLTSIPHAGSRIYCLLLWSEASSESRRMFFFFFISSVFQQHGSITWWYTCRKQTWSKMSTTTRETHPSVLLGLSHLEHDPLASKPKVELCFLNSTISSK